MVFPNTKGRILHHDSQERGFESKTSRCAWSHLGRHTQPYWIWGPASLGGHWEERLIWMWGIKKGEPLEGTVTGESIQPRVVRECKECCHGERVSWAKCLWTWKKRTWRLSQERKWVNAGMSGTFHSTPAESQFLGMLSGSGLGKLPLYRTRQ